MSLEKEQATYVRELAGLLPNIGKYVLIQGDTVVGVYSEYEAALGAGYDKFGLDPFMVKKIQAIEQTQSFTRDISPCRI
jgi:hypothetical protein